VLGPLLYILYVNDFPLMPTQNVTMYADDTTIAVKNRHLLTAKSEANIVVAKAEEWFRDIGLFLNSSKTQSLVLGKRIEVWRADNHPVKMLGVEIDGAGTWKAQCCSVETQLNSILFLLRALKDTVSKEVLLRVYWACFHSKMSYCIMVWGHSAWTKGVFKTQRKALRIIGNLSFREDCRSTFKSLEVLTFPCVYMLKCLEYVAARKDSYQRIGDGHAYDTRRGNDLHVEYSRLGSCRNALSYYGIHFYNALPESVRNLPTGAFKRRIKTFMKRGAFYSFAEYFEEVQKWSPDII